MNKNIKNNISSINVIYQDNHIIVVEKPVGVPSQADKTGDVDMLTYIKKYLKEKYNKPGEVYLGLLHRLDRMVGGIMVFAKTSKAASRLSETIRNRDLKKQYIAVVNGNIEANDNKKIELKNYLVKNEETNTSRICDEKTKEAKLAELEFKVLGNITYNEKDYTYIKVFLHTGRHHQIRVQMAGIGHPLYGDVKYGAKVNKVGQDIGLFACYIEFAHPTKDEIMKFSLLPEKLGIWKDINI